MLQFPPYPKPCVGSSGSKRGHPLSEGRRTPKFCGDRHDEAALQLPAAPRRTGRPLTGAGSGMAVDQWRALALVAITAGSRHTAPAESFEHGRRGGVPARCTRPSSTSPASTTSSRSSTRPLPASSGRCWAAGQSAAGASRWPSPRTSCSSRAGAPTAARPTTCPSSRLRCTTRARTRRRTARSATRLSIRVGGRAGLRQGPSSLNPAGVNGLTSAKQYSMYKAPHPKLFV